MRNLSIIRDQCTCPIGKNKYRQMESFHDAAIEIEEILLEKSPFNGGL